MISSNVRVVRLSSLLAILMLAVGCPIGPFAGGRLGGDVQPTPVADWSFAEREETCQLETNPDDPHSVNTWCVGEGRYLYVPTSMILGPGTPSEREWVQNVETDPDVRVRIAGMVYELRASRVSDDAEYERIFAALSEKYADQFDPKERDVEREIWIFRMHPR